MLRSNQSYVDAVRDHREQVCKAKLATPPSEKMRRFLEYYNEVKNKKLPAGATVLDFGCGIGQEVAWLADQGYSAQGVDIIEYWGKDGSLWGETQSNSWKDLMDRLHLVDAADNILPFPDATFELIVSNQTLEHVFDYRPVFIEQARVLKPGGLAIHRFPHGHGLIEPHTKVPLTYLNKY